MLLSGRSRGESFSCFFQPLEASCVPWPWLLPRSSKPAEQDLPNSLLLMYHSRPPTPHPSHFPTASLTWQSEPPQGQTRGRLSRHHPLCCGDSMALFPLLHEDSKSLSLTHHLVPTVRLRPAHCRLSFIAVCPVNQRRIRSKRMTGVCRQPAAH